MVISIIYCQIFDTAVTWKAENISNSLLMWGEKNFSQNVECINWLLLAAFYKKPQEIHQEKKKQASQLANESLEALKSAQKMHWKINLFLLDQCTNNFSREGSRAPSLKDGLRVKSKY